MENATREPSWTNKVQGITERHYKDGIVLGDKLTSFVGLASIYSDDSLKVVLSHIEEILKHERLDPEEEVIFRAAVVFLNEILKDESQHSCNTFNCNSGVTA